MTHPFHPLHGKRFELLTYRKTWGEDRVFFQEAGRLRALPAGWTDAVEPPVFVTLAAGRAHFRPDDLLRLAELVHGARALREPSVSTQEPNAGAAESASSKLRRHRKEKDATQAKSKDRRTKERDR